MRIHPWRPCRTPTVAFIYSLAAPLILLLACTGGADQERDDGEERTTSVNAAIAGAGVLPGGVAAPPPSITAAGGPTARDLEIFEATLRWAREERLDTVPLGDAIVRLGRRFVGYPYTPGTLETPGGERLVVNLREFDCVTYVETVLVLARMIRAGEDDFATFQNELTRVRYRGGTLDGYASRLHYFSEWIGDNEAKGLLRDITGELGGRRIDEPIDFMSNNAGAYPLLADARELSAIRSTERRLSAAPRFFIPERQIGTVEGSIRDGDIIAATSSVEGLDVAHTGFAIWVDGRLHLMHAPLVGRNLEISELPLAERILGFEGQDGVMVARPI